MNNKMVSLIYLILFLIFLFNTECLGAADLALGCNLVLLIALLLYFGITHILNAKLIPKSNIFIWILLSVINIPIIIFLVELNVINTSTGPFGLGEGDLEYLFLLPMNMSFPIGLIIENIIIYLILKFKKSCNK